MADKKLEYWNDWEILGPNDEVLFRPRKSPPPIDNERLSDTDYLCERINEYPDPTLMNDGVWYRITILRQEAFKNRKAADDLKRICKAIQGDGRSKKDENTLDDLKVIIQGDIAFFKKVLDRNKNEGINIQEAISKFLAEGAQTDSQMEGREREQSNYENTYYSYKQIYDKLKSLKLKDAEIFCFLEKAGSNINKANIIIQVTPDDRLLTFLKVRTWYVKGPDMDME